MEVILQSAPAQSSAGSRGSEKQQGGPGRKRWEAWLSAEPGRGPLVVDGQVDKNVHRRGGVEYPECSWGWSAEGKVGRGRRDRELVQPHPREGASVCEPGLAVCCSWMWEVSPHSLEGQTEVGADSGRVLDLRWDGHRDSVWSALVSPLNMRPSHQPKTRSVGRRLEEAWELKNLSKDRFVMTRKLGTLLDSVAEPRAYVIRLLVCWRDLATIFCMGQARGMYICAFPVLELAQQRA